MSALIPEQRLAEIEQRARSPIAYPFGGVTALELLAHIRAQAAENDRLSAPFNKLTNAQAERLAKLAEEAGEVVQAAMKILRHGYDSFNPDDPAHEGNRAQLERELGDLHGVINLMLERGDIFGVPLFAPERALRFMHHQSEDPAPKQEDHLPFSLDREINRGQS